MKKLLGSLLVAAGMAFSSLPAAFAENVDVTFLLINDIDKMAGKKSKRGGFARVNAIAKAERAKGGNLVYAIAGDFLSPSLLSGIDKGAHIVDLLNVASPDIVVPGNHEFDFGKDIFLKRIKELKSKILSANLRHVDDSKVDGIEDTMIKTFGDASDPMKSIKIGFVGLTLEGTPVISSPGDLKFANTVKTALSNAKALKEQGADILVAIQHDDIITDRELLGTGKFDFILSGHDHDLLVNYNGRSVLAESRSQGDLVVALDVTFTVSEKRGKRRVKWWPNFRIIDTADITPDPDTLAKVKTYQAELSKELDVTIGNSSTELDSRRATVRSAEAAIGNLIADAQRAAHGADVALANGGGIRGDKVYAPGTELSRRDILTELPFGNKNVLLEVDGKTILAVLENGVSQVEKGAGRFPQISGMSFTFDKSKPAGSRVSDVKVGDAPLDLAKMYTMATNDYAAGGGDGYKMLRGAKVLKDSLSAKLLANDVMAYVRKQGSVSPKVEGRIKGM